MSEEPAHRDLHRVGRLLEQDEPHCYSQRWFNPRSSERLVLVPVPSFLDLVQPLAWTMRAPCFRSFVTLLASWLFAPRRLDAASHSPQLDALTPELLERWSGARPSSLTADQARARAAALGCVTSR